MSMPAPPGMLSPAAFPFPAAPFPQNDVPIANAPYLIAQKTSGLSGTTLPVRTFTNRGDAIVVSCFGGAPTSPFSVTDTQGNAYVATTSTTNTNNTIQFVASNTSPLGSADSITVSGTNASGRALTLIVGIPSALLGPGSFLSPALSATPYAQVNQTVLTATTPANVPIPAGSLIVAAVMGEGASGATPTPQLPQGWNVVATFLGNIPGSFPTFPPYGVVAWKLITTRIPAGSNVLWSLQNPALFSSAQLVYTVLMPETRFAPRQPPDMPPGMLSPGAWQYAPLGNPMEGPATTRYNPGPNKWTETLPAVPAVISVVARSTGKPLATTAHPAAGLSRARVKLLAATAHAAGVLAKAAAKLLAATTHPAGSLRKAVTAILAAAVIVHAARTAAAAKTLPAVAHATAKLAKVARKTIPATVHPAATLARSTGKRLTAAAQPAGVLKKVAAVARKAAVTVHAARTAAIGKLLAASAHPAGVLAKVARKALRATAHPAGAVARSTGKILTATARAAASVSRGRRQLLAALVTATARIAMPNRIPLFRFGAAAWRWVTGSARNQ